MTFQSTLSVRRATPCTFALTSRDIFQSTLSVRRATTCQELGFDDFTISIHALREESDRVDMIGAALRSYISIHALREESDAVHGLPHVRRDISIHALREESDASTSC